MGQYKYMNIRALEDDGLLLSITRQSCKLNMLPNYLDITLILGGGLQSACLFDALSGRRGVTNPRPPTTPYVPSSAYGVSVGLGP